MVSFLHHAVHKRESGKTSVPGVTMKLFIFLGISGFPNIAKEQTGVKLTT